MMKSNYGEFIPLPYNDARSLEAQGHVRIIDPAISEKLKADSAYIFKAAYSGRRLSRVAWIQNYDKNGGAEISNFNCINAGNNFGFDIVSFDPAKSGISILENADIIIVNNMHSAGRENTVKFLLSTSKPFIVYSHDPFETEKELFVKSQLNVFISPKHFEYYVAKFGEEIRSKSIVLPLSFDPERFVFGKEKRIPDSVLIVNYDKCRNNAVAYVADHPEMNFDCIGTAIPFGKNSKKIENIPYDQMQNLYKKYETVYHCPDKFCAGERVIIEAVLSGCNVVTNENAGHSSHTEFDWQDVTTLREVLPESVSKFWREVEKILNSRKSIVSSKPKTISIVTRNMGRKSFLERTLPTWVSFEQIEKIIVVDWGMKEDLSDLVIDRKVEVVQVPEKIVFEQGESWNVGIRRCTSDYVFMVDCDVLFNEKSFALNKLLNRVAAGEYADNAFVCCAVHPNHLTGTSIFPKAMIDSVNGFCERLPTRGFEEIDLRNRCHAKGAVKKLDLWPGMLEHIDHDDAARFENMDKEMNIIEADRINQAHLQTINVSKQERVKSKCNILTSKGIEEGVVV